MPLSPQKVRRILLSEDNTIAAYRYNVIIEVDINSSKANAGQAQVTGQLRGLGTQVQAVERQIGTSVSNIDAGLAKNTSTVSQWGRAFKGAFIGAVAGIAFSTIIGGMASIVEKGEELIVQSVKYAAAFEMRENAMKLFTGSTTAALQELASLDDLSRRTPGLRMEDAEVGATRLRALGFEASTAANLVAGIAKQRLISGVTDEQAVNRVIVNLQQLKAGSPQIERDIRQMVLALPSLSLEIERTFGSVSKFKKELREDSGAALEKFAKGLADAKSPAGGLTNALEKLEDELMVAGRTFGMPMLEPLTEGATELTQVLRANKDVWTSWGNDVANAIQGVIDVANGLGAVSHFLGLDIPDEQAGYARRGLRYGGRLIAGGVANALTGGAYGAYQAFGAIGEYDRMNRPLGGLVEGRVGGKSEAQLTEGQKAEMEKAMKGYHQRDLQILSDAYKQQAKLLNNHHRFTLADELAYEKQLGKLRIQGVDAEISLRKKQYAQDIEMAEGDKQKILEIETDFVQSASKLQTQKVDAVVEAAEKERDLLIRIEEEKRQAMIEAVSLERRSIEQASNARQSILEREIERNGTGYQALIDEVTTTNAKIEAEMRRSADLQLQDQTLTAEKRVNIEREVQLDIEDLHNQTNDRIRQIQDRQNQDNITRMHSYFDRVRNLMQQDVAGISQLMDTFSNNVFFGSGIQNSLALPSAIGYGNSGDVRGNVNDVEMGKISIYEAQFDLLGKIHDKQLEIADIEVREAKEGVTYAQKFGTGTEVRQEQARLRAAEQAKAILGLTQDLERANLEINNSEKEINEWTQKIKDGKKDAVLHDLSSVDLARQRRDAAIEQRTIEVTMQDQKLVGMMRETEMVKVITNARREELAAVFAIDKAQFDIAQQYKYSSTKADARVAQFLASQKGITDIVADAKINLLTDAYSGLENVIGRLTKKMGFFGDSIKSLISDLAKLLLNKVFQFLFGGKGGFGSSSGGFTFGSPQQAGGGSGGGLAALFNMGQGGGFGIPGMGQGGTPLFNPNTGGSGGGLSIGPSPVEYAIGSDGKLLAMDPNGGGLLGVGTSAGGALATGGFTKGIASILPTLGLGLGSTLGKGNTGASILGAVGGGLAGLIGTAVIAPSLLSTGAVAMLTNPFTAIIAAGLLIFAALWGKSARRKKEEKAHQKAIGTALDAIEKLIADVNSDKIDGGAAIAQAEQIRQQYLDEVSKLKDKKVRQKAMADVSRIDAKIEQLKAAVGNQVSRKERLDLMAPTFADGGATSGWMSQYSHNPLGYQTGPGTSRSDNMLGYFPASGRHAWYSPTEYILDAETTRNVGIGNLDFLRATKGRSFAEMRKNMPVSRASGGTTVSMAPSGGSQTVAISPDQPITLEIALNVGLSEETFAEVISSSIKKNNGSTQQLSAIIKILNDDGQGALARAIAKAVAPLLK